MSTVDHLSLPIRRNDHSMKAAIPVCTSSQLVQREIWTMARSSVNVCGVMNGQMDTYRWVGRG